jgi:PII-like signaling protein
VIEIIDESHKIEPFIEHIRPYFEKAQKGYIITLDDTTILMHKTGSKKS